MNAEEIAAVLEAHLLLWPDGEGDPMCSCGEWSTPEMDKPEDAHHAHVAEQIAALMPEATETVEHALRHRDGWIAGPGDVVADPGYPGAVAVMRRTRTTYADRVSEWEAAGDE